MTVTLLRYIDVVLVVAAAPILLLVGAPTIGYTVGAAVWIMLRVAGLAVDRRAGAIGDASRELTLRLGYALVRVLALALAIILVRQRAGRHDGLSALLVIAFAFTVQLALSIATRPRSR